MTTPRKKKDSGISSENQWLVQMIHFHLKIGLFSKGHLLIVVLGEQCFPKGLKPPPSLALKSMNMYTPEVLKTRPW